MARLALESHGAMETRRWTVPAPSADQIKADPLSFPLTVGLSSSLLLFDNVCERKVQTLAAVPGTPGEGSSCVSNTPSRSQLLAHSLLSLSFFFSGQPWHWKLCTRAWWCRQIKQGWPNVCLICWTTCVPFHLTRWELCSRKFTMYWCFCFLFFTFFTPSRSPFVSLPTQHKPLLSVHNPL